MSKVGAPLRIAVVGVGYFGRLHATKFADMDGATLVSVADQNPDRAAEVAEEFGAKPVSDYRDLLGDVDAVTIATTTSLHYEVAKFFLSNGVPVFIEKPITDNLSEAEELVRLADSKGLTLQVGHIERFSGLYEALVKEVTRPLFIETIRIGPFAGRGTDVSVILDLMIHDIDLVLGLVDAPILALDALGAPVFSENDDIAGARIKFANGCVVQLTASRMSLKRERRMRVFQPDCYVTVDFDNKTLRVMKQGKAEEGRLAPVDMRDVNYSEDDSLRAELEDFVDCVRTGRRPRVSGEEGRIALETALATTKALTEHRELVRRGGLLDKADET